MGTEQSSEVEGPAAFDRGVLTRRAAVGAALAVPMFALTQDKALGGTRTPTAPFVVTAPVTTADNTIVPTATTVVDLTLQAVAAQTADLLQVRNSAALSLLRITSAGDVEVAPPTRQSDAVPTAVKVLRTIAAFGNSNFGVPPGSQFAGIGVEVEQKMTAAPGAPTGAGVVFDGGWGVTSRTDTDVGTGRTLQHAINFYAYPLVRTGYVNNVYSYRSGLSILNTAQGVDQVKTFFSSQPFVDAAVNTFTYLWATVPTGSGTIGTLYGVLLNNLVGRATTTWAIRTEGGSVFHAAGSPTTIPLIVQGDPAHAVNLQEWRNSSGTVLSAIANDGAYKLVSGAGAGLTARSDASGKLSWGESSIYPKWKTGRYYSSPGVISTITAAVQRLYFAAIWVPKPCTLDRIGAQVNIVGAGSAARVGIYNDDGFGSPGSLLFEAGSTLDTAGSTGFKEATISQPIGAGLYWLAFVAQGGTPNMRTVSNFMSFTEHWDPSLGANAVIVGFYQDSVSGALPATATPVNLDGGIGGVPRIYVRMA